MEPLEHPRRFCRRLYHLPLDGQEAKADQYGPTGSGATDGAIVRTMGLGLPIGHTAKGRELVGDDANWPAGQKLTTRLEILARGEPHRGRTDAFQLRHSANVADELVQMPAA